MCYPPSCWACCGTYILSVTGATNPFWSTHGRHAQKVKVKVQLLSVSVSAEGFVSAEQYTAEKHDLESRGQTLMQYFALHQAHGVMHS